LVADIKSTIGMIGTLILIFLISFNSVGSSAYAASGHTSGYNHGCSDAQISDPSNRYINQPEKGPSFHSEAFMRAYNEGYDNCSKDSTSSTDQALSPYYSGYKHGFNDAKAGKGFTVKSTNGHTEEYSRGYEEGWRSGCNKFMNLPPDTAEGCELSMDTGH
jgi:hypothetical protein